MRMLVVGGTGMLGAPVARGLAADGHSVRVLSRHPATAHVGAGIQVVRGDVDDPESIRRAVEGAEGIHVSLDGKGDWDLERRGAETVAKAAAAAGVSRITLISGASVCEENAWFPMTAAKLAAERAVQASGVPYTILRCTMFMETLRNMVREGKAMLLGDQPQRWHFLAADDFARMVSRAYASPEAANRVLVAFGPEALTLEEALRVYVDRCAPGTPVMKIPFFILGLMSWLPGRAELRRVALPLMKYFAKVPEQGSPVEADRLLGKNEITLERWCAAQLEPPSPTPEEAAPSPP